MKPYHDKSHPPKVLVVCAEESRTKQSEAAACDVNRIVARYAQAGVPLPAEGGFYADVSQIGDFRAVLAHVERAKQVFARLSAKQRAAFDNEPAVFLDFVSGATREELIEAGLLPAEVVVDTPAPAENPPVSDGGSDN